MSASMPVRVLACLSVVCVALAGCTSSGKRVKVVTVTTTVEPSSPSSTRSSSARPSSTAPSSTSAPAPHRQTALPGTCDTLLPVTTVNSAAGTAITGRTSFVVGTPDPTILRIAYLNCRYGITSSGGAAKVEIGVSLYRTSGAASSRVDATVSDFEAHGATSADVTVGATDGQVLTGGVGTGYTGTTVVAASGQRTVAVTVADSVPSARTAAVQIAAVALAKSAR